MKTATVVTTISAVSCAQLPNVRVDGGSPRGAAGLAARPPSGRSKPRTRHRR